MRLVQQILPRAHYLPLELSKINGVAFMPRNTESHGLAAGALQLAEGTQVIVDEGKLGEGTVQGVGWFFNGSIPRRLPKLICVLNRCFESARLEERD